MTRRIFLDAEHDRAMRRDGYIVLDLLQTTDVERLATCFAAVDAAHSGDFSATSLSDDEACRRTVHDDVAAVLGPRLLPLLDDYRIAVATYVVKRADSQLSTVAVHQDFTFIKEDDQVGLTLWCPLVDVDADNGWLGVLPGSHLFNQEYREPFYMPYQELIDMIEERYLKYLPMRAGQVLFMDNRLFHGSPRNRSASPRIVAGGVAVPRSKPLLYCHRDDDETLEIYEVAEDFYVRHDIGRRPAEGRLLGRTPRRAGTLTEGQLAAHWHSLPTSG